MLGFPRLADENVSPEVITLLRNVGADVLSAEDTGLGGPDVDILRQATAEGRVVLTHDLDFGRLCIADGDFFVARSLGRSAKPSRLLPS
jgi:predicted nuclease of predicted toxin-antitoxin system